MRSHDSTMDAILGLMIEETWDVTDAIATLEARRARLRDAILALCRKTRVDRYRHARGTLRVERHASYRVRRASEVLGILNVLGWEDSVLKVDGRALHALAQKRADAQAYFSQTFPEVRHEVLVLAPARR